jgi:hypothetical protein
MVLGCKKIMGASRSTWVIFLGDDDPILMPARQLILLLNTSLKQDHIFFQPYILSHRGPCKFEWFPRLVEKNYRTEKLCARTGFTTFFAFLGSHAFRRIPRMQEKWMAAHRSCMFYGHVVMLLHHYQTSFFCHQPLAAWNPGNERIDSQQNLLRHLELRQILSPPLSPVMKRFIRLKPLEVVQQGRFPLINHLSHAAIMQINKFAGYSSAARITPKKVRTLIFDKNDPIHIFPSQGSTLKASCIFVKNKGFKKINSALFFCCGPKVNLKDIAELIFWLDLSGPIYLRNKKITLMELVIFAENEKTLTKLHLFFMAAFSMCLYGPANFDLNHILKNYFSRPRKNFYKVVLMLEKIPRQVIKKVLGIKNYYSLKMKVFGKWHFRHTRRFRV